MKTDSAEDWDLVDDDGFIFKRRKMSEISPGEPPTASEIKRSADDQQRFKELLARRKKVAILEAQKIKYTAEIEEWERLLNERDFEIGPKDLAVSEVQESSEQVLKDESDDTIDLSELQMQVEVYEVFIERLKKLRDDGEKMSNMLEKTIKNEKSKQFKGLIDEMNLLRNSPRFLIGGLTSSQPGPLGIKALAVSSELGRLLAQSPA